MFFAIDDTLSSKTWNVNVMWITSLKNGDDSKTAPNYELLIYQGDGGRPLIETFTSASERSDRRDAIIAAGYFFELNDIQYNICWVQSIAKIDVGNPMLDGNLAKNPTCSVTFANGRTLYGIFDSEQDRDDFYDLLASLSAGGGGGGTPIQTGGKLIQKPTKDDFPKPGDTKNTYVAKDKDIMYYWDASANEYVALGSVGGSAVLEKQIVSNTICGAAAANTTFNKDMTFTEFAEKILRKDITPIISTSFKDKGTSVNAGIREKGVSVPGVTMTLNITNLSQVTVPIKEVNFYVGSSKVNTVSYTNNKSSYSYTYNTAITNDTVCKAELIYDGSKVSSGTGKYEFIYGRFVGVTQVDIDNSNVNSFITTASKDLVKSKAKTWSNITLNDERFVYMYPQSYGMLSDIKDGNGFGQIDGYTPSVVTVNYPTNNDSVQYYVWVLDDPATGTGFTQVYS